jgi:hypothetical protein
MNESGLNSEVEKGLGQKQQPQATILLVDDDPLIVESRQIQLRSA